MATRQYTVTIETPEGEDEFDYEVTITRHGQTVSEFRHPLMYARDSIGAAIFLDMEGEENKCIVCGYSKWLHGSEYRTGSPVCQKFSGLVK